MISLYIMAALLLRCLKKEKSVNLQMIKDGQAVVYRDYLNACLELRDRLLQAEASAKTWRIGFWNQTNSVLPQDFRRGKRSNSSSSATPTRNNQAKPAAAQDYDCNNFRTQAEAQKVLNSRPGDPYKLDSDGDNVACESLP